MENKRPFTRNNGYNDYLTENTATKTEETYKY